MIGRQAGRRADRHTDRQTTGRQAGAVLLFQLLPATRAAALAATQCMVLPCCCQQPECQLTQSWAWLSEREGGTAAMTCAGGGVTGSKSVRCRWSSAICTCPIVYGKSSAHIRPPLDGNGLYDITALMAYAVGRIHITAAKCPGLQKGGQRVTHAVPVHVFTLHVHASCRHNFVCPGAMFNVITSTTL